MFNYGLTQDKYVELLDKQGGGCAICDKDNGKMHLAVDHDHSTGAIRGLLCNSCNRGLGLLGDTVKRLEQALEYLKGGETH